MSEIKPISQATQEDIRLMAEAAAEQLHYENPFPPGPQRDTFRQYYQARILLCND